MLDGIVAIIGLIVIVIATPIIWRVCNRLMMLDENNEFVPIFKKRKNTKEQTHE